MGKMNLLIRVAGIVYVASVLQSRFRSKRPLVGIGILLLWLLRKIHEIGCWKYKLKNRDINIMYYRPFTGSLLKIIETAEDNFHPRAVREALRSIAETKEPFTIYGTIKVNDNAAFCYHLYDPKVIKYVFEDHFEDYVKGPMIHDTFEELFGDGIFAADPPDWKFHRKVASRMFSMRNLKDYMFDCAVQNTAILVDKMNELSGDDHNNVMDMFELFGRFTLQSFIQSAFGERLPIIESLPAEHTFCSAFDRLLRECEDRTVDVFWRVRRYFGIGQREGVDIPRDTKILDDFAAKIINDRNKKQNIVDESGAEKHDLLSLFLKHGGMQQRQMDKKGIRDITMNFVIAARDTTRILLSWFFYEVSKPENKEILENIYREIDSYKQEELTYVDCSPYLGGGGGGKSLSKKNEKEASGHDRKYQYLEAVLCEILRLYPPVPFLQRYCKRDGIQIPYRTLDGKDNTLYLNQGDGVCVYTNAYLRLPSIWGTNGRDPDKINVDNFYENGVNTYTPYVFPVFNLNPRLCLGKTSALMQAKIVAISIMRKCIIEPVPNQDVQSVLSPILVMKDGFKVRIKPRKLYFT